MHDLRTGVYPDVRFTREVFSFEQLRTKEKQLLTQFNKTGTYSFLNLGNFQNVFLEEVEHQQNREQLPLKIGHLPKTKSK